MQTSNRMGITDNCLNCPVRDEHLFCDLSEPALQRFDEVKSTAIYPAGALLFIEGQRPRGIFVLCSGQAKLSTSSRDGKTIITGISKAGDVLGLSAVIAAHAYEVTAEMIEPGQANFISRESLLQLAKERSEVGFRIGQQISLDYFSAYEEIRTLGISRSPAEKFAKLLLSWWPNHETNGCAQIKLLLTHTEIAEMIGTTRETVSRLFSLFTEKKLLQRAGATLIFRDRPALQHLVHW